MSDAIDSKKISRRNIVAGIAALRSCALLPSWTRAAPMSSWPRAWRRRRSPQAVPNEASLVSPLSIRDY